MHFQTVLSGFWKKKAQGTWRNRVSRKGLVKIYSHAHSVKSSVSLFCFLVKENPDYIGGEEDRNQGPLHVLLKTIQKIIFNFPKPTVQWVTLCPLLPSIKYSEQWRGDCTSRNMNREHLEWTAENEVPAGLLMVMMQGEARRGKRVERTWVIP